MREVVARTVGLQIQVLNASTSREVNAAFATLVRERPDALFVGAYATTQVEALRRLRNDGSQIVRVEHVHVNEGGQAVTGPGARSAGGPRRGPARSTSRGVVQRCLHQSFASGRQSRAVQRGPRMDHHGPPPFPQLIGGADRPSTVEGSR